jgi:hypothetical protein
MFYTVGSSSISSDEVLKAAELRSRREGWEKSKKNRIILVAKKTVEEKAKECLERVPNPVRGWSVADLKVILKWKMSPEEFAAEKVSSSTKEKLQTLLDKHINNEIADIDVPPEIAEPAIPRLDETEVGRAAARNAELTLSCVDKLPNETLATMVRALQNALTCRREQA